MIVLIAFDLEQDRPGLFSIYRALEPSRRVSFHLSSQSFDSTRIHSKIFQIFDERCPVVFGAAKVPHSPPSVGYTEQFEFVTGTVRSEAGGVCKQRASYSSISLSVPIGKNTDNGNNWKFGHGLEKN